MTAVMRYGVEYDSILGVNINNIYNLSEELDAKQLDLV